MLQILEASLFFMLRYAFLDALISSAIDMDGRNSTEKTIFCPLFKNETAPAGNKMMVRNFSL
ncbi:MAG: hypothetical protein ACI4A8_03115 [Muribaculaceae bacterium]